jgi:hypothetical protein
MNHANQTSSNAPARRRIGWTAALLIGLVACLSPTPAGADHPYDFAFDRLEIDGDRFGPFDGVPDFVDEFDSSDNWKLNPYGGSGYIGGGLLHLTSPGNLVPYVGGIVFDRSEAYTNFNLGGAGSFSVTLTFKHQLLPLPDHQLAQNDAVAISLWGCDEYFGVGLSNWEEAIAQPLGAQAGYGIYQDYILNACPTPAVDGVIIEGTGVNIDPSTIAGDVQLRLSFDDATHTLTSSYSIDGGTTFQSPFPPHAFFNPGFSTSHPISVFGDPTDPPATPTPTPTPTPHAITGKKLLIKLKPGDSSKTVIGAMSKDPTLDLGGGNGSADDPTVNGGGIRIRSQLAGFDTTYALPAAGWKAVGPAGQNKGYIFLSKTGPIRKVLLKPGPRGLLLVSGKGPDVAVNLDTNPSPVDVVLTIGSRQSCAAYGGTVNFVAMGKLLARDAAAPAACP